MDVVMHLYDVVYAVAASSKFPLYEDYELPADKSDDKT